MLGVLFRWLAARAWRAAHRSHLFTFYDGQRWRSIDAWRAYREFTTDEQFDLLSQCEAVDQREEPDTTQCIEALCRAFRVERYNPETRTGMADAEILGLMAQFLAYCDAVKKKPSPGLTSPPSTALALSDSPADPLPPGPSPSGSTSTATDRSTATAPLSPQESQPPLGQRSTNRLARNSSRPSAPHQLRIEDLPAEGNLETLAPLLERYRGQ